MQEVIQTSNPHERRLRRTDVWVVLARDGDRVRQSGAVVPWLCALSGEVGRRAVAHIDMSVGAAEVASDVVPTLRLVGGARPLEGWLHAVGEAEEPCLLLDRDGVVLGASPSCHDVLGLPVLRGALVGRGLLEDVIELIDFSAARLRLRPDEIERIPPLFALSTGALARGLMRIRSNGNTWTLDAIATPLRVGGVVLGSMTFFQRV